MTPASSSAVAAGVVALIAPAVACACEISVPEVNRMMTQRADCSFENAGPLDGWSGDLAQDIGGGVVVQSQEISSCVTDEMLAVTDCRTGGTVVISPAMSENAFPRSLDTLFAPGGPVAIRRDMTVDDLVAQVRRHGARVTGWAEMFQALDVPAADVPSPACGCGVFYPELAGAGS